MRAAFPFLLVGLGLATPAMAQPSASITSASWSASDCHIVVFYDYDDDYNSVSWVLQYAGDDEVPDGDFYLSLPTSGAGSVPGESVNVTTSLPCDITKVRIAADDGGGSPYIAHSAWFTVTGTRHANCGCGGGGGDPPGGSDPTFTACLDGADLMIEVIAPTPSDVQGWTVENITTASFDFTQATTTLGDGVSSGSYASTISATVGDEVRVIWQDSGSTAHNLASVTVAECSEGGQGDSCGCLGGWDEDSFTRFEDEQTKDTDGDGCPDKDDPEPNDPDIGCVEQDYTHPEDPELDNKYLNIPDVWEEIKKIAPPNAIATPVGFACRDHVILFDWQLDEPLHNFSFNFEWHTLPSHAHGFGGQQTTAQTALFDALRLVIKNLAFFGMTVFFGRLTFKTLARY